MTILWPTADDDPVALTIDPEQPTFKVQEHPSNLMDMTRGVGDSVAGHG